MSKSKRRIRSKQHREKLRKLRIWKRIFIALGILLVCGLFIWAVNADTFAVQQIDVRGNAATDAAQITELTESQLGGAYYWIFPRNNVFLVPDAEITRVITEEIPHIQDVSVTRAGFYGLVVEVVERKPSAVWCADQYSEGELNAREVEEAITDAEQSSCYFLDNTGFIFAAAPEFTGPVYFQYYAPLPEENQPPIGQHFLGAQKFQALSKFIERIKDLGLHPVLYEQRPGGTSALVLVDKNEDVLSGTLRFNIHDDLTHVFANLAEIVESGTIFGGEESEEGAVRALTAPATTTDRKDLEYIDLRYGNKVYFRRAQ